MTSTAFDCAGVCYPVSLLYNDELQFEFVGYLMPKATGTELQKSIFIKPLFERKYKDWTRIDLVELLVNIYIKLFIYIQKIL